MKRQTYLPPPPAAARTADAAVGAHDTDSTRASHLNLRLKPGEKLHAGSSVKQKCK